jgi:pSer/pThr/pTyr-binding forkhead associated (FHA) protein
MSPQTVTLTVVTGPLVGQQYEFGVDAVHVLGRAPGCSPQLPDEPPHKDVSRHHCLLSVRLPELRLLDLGSSNGTFVNGVKVRQSACVDSGSEGDPPAWHPLEDGDVITLGGNTVLLIRVRARQEEGDPPWTGAGTGPLAVDPRAGRPVEECSL